MSQAMLDTWGFDQLVTVNLEVSDTMESLNAQARERGILPGKPADALDASRDVIITDALPSGYAWQISGRTLVVYPITLSATDVAGIIERHAN